jgi:hypothetical protein
MTYSIITRCPQSGAFGIAVTSSSIAVASRCAWVGQLGAVSTQNVTDPALGTAGLAAAGLGAGAVLKLLIAGTPEPEWRQIGVIVRYGQCAIHSGTGHHLRPQVLRGLEQFRQSDIGVVRPAQRAAGCLGGARAPARRSSRRGR